MTKADHERREHPRVAAERACKVYDPRSRRYTAGHTIDLSRGGLRLVLQRSLPVDAGDTLYVAVATPHQPTLLTRSDFATAHVVRTVAGTAELAVRIGTEASMIEVKDVAATVEPEEFIDEAVAA